ncbi:PXA domain-containing protein [Cladochytrium replicatum]|nr:PXA domain-containing protein [Cladochytrium replicatum]
MTTITAVYHSIIRPTKLTSSPIVDEELHALFAHIMNDFILTWYSFVSPDDREFLGEIMKTIRFLTVTLEDRLAKVDMVAVLAKQLPQILRRHLHDFRHCRAKVGTAYAGGRSLEELFHGSQPHFALDDPEREMDYIRRVVDILVEGLLPRSETQSDTVRFLLREILSCTVLLNTVEKVCDPDFINQLIVRLLSDEEFDDTQPFLDDLTAGDEYHTGPDGDIRPFAGGKVERRRGASAGRKGSGVMGENYRPQNDGFGQRIMGREQTILGGQMGGHIYAANDGVNAGTRTFFKRLVIRGKRSNTVGGIPGEPGITSSIINRLTFGGLERVTSGFDRIKNMVKDTDRGYTLSTHADGHNSAIEGKEMRRRRFQRRKKGASRKEKSSTTPSRPETPFQDSHLEYAEDDEDIPPQSSYINDYARLMVPSDSLHPRPVLDDAPFTMIRRNLNQSTYTDEVIFSDTDSNAEIADALRPNRRRSSLRAIRTSDIGASSNNDSESMHTGTMDLTDHSQSESPIHPVFSNDETGNNSSPESTSPLYEDDLGDDINPIPDDDETSKQQFLQSSSQPQNPNESSSATQDPANDIINLQSPAKRIGSAYPYTPRPSTQLPPSNRLSDPPLWSQSPPISAVLKLFERVYHLVFLPLWSFIAIFMRFFQADDEELAILNQSPQWSKYLYTEESLDQPLLDLVNEALMITKHQKWLVTQIAFFLGPLAHGICRNPINWNIIKLLRFILAEGQVAYYIKNIRLTLWPHGYWVDDVPIRTPEDKEATRREAESGIKRLMPELLKVVVGEENVDGAVTDLMQAFQRKSINKHLVYFLVDAIVTNLMPEAADIDSSSYDHFQR